MNQKAVFMPRSISRLPALALVRANENSWKDVLAGATLGSRYSYCFTDTRKGTQFSAIFGPNSAYAQFNARG